MNDTLDELAKGLAQSVTRRQALRRFGAALTGAVLATLGLKNKAEAGQRIGCQNNKDCEAAYGRGARCGGCRPCHLYGQRYQCCQCYPP